MLIHDSRTSSLSQAANLLDFPGRGSHKLKFNPCGITVDDTKYLYVLVALNQQTAMWLLDLIS